MNHLIRTLTESQVKPTVDLRLLLTTVKEGRRLKDDAKDTKDAKDSKDSKLSDPFYDSLEGLLSDLRAVTVDNRDADAFLKPVSKAEVPDYYEVIANPMDFQTMQRKVKQKTYKSKREFKDDLELIWSNCYTYNASENHPLRQCVKRLQAKAETLLKYITDRKDRLDPTIPSGLPSPTGIARPRINGSNGYLGSHSSHTRSPSFTIGSKSSTPTSSTFYKSSVPIHLRRPPRDAQFSDTPALIRTGEGMVTFLDFDRQIGSPNPRKDLAHKLRDLAPIVDYEDESPDVHTPDDSAMIVDGASGDKRKMNGFIDQRPRKRTRYTTQYPTPLLDEKDDLSQLWWSAVQSDSLLANGLPGIPFGPSSSSFSRGSSSSKLHLSPTKPKRRKPSKQQQQPANPKSLLSMMNNNIMTMRRVRHTHAKFTALNASTAPPEEEEQGGEGGGGGGVYGSAAIGGTATRAGMPSAAGFVGNNFGLGEDDSLADKIDEEPWTTGRGKKGKAKNIDGVEIGEANATDCLHWAGNKILEHAGFQATSKVALGVLAAVTSEYLLNVGRTIRFLSDKFGKTMTPEEIILHTLFESGSSKVQDLERYISDDIERYGSRLGELEKKIVGAYRETAAGELLEDEGLFEEEDEDETGALAIGDFADVLGEDYLGLRALGIAAEFGLSNLSIPKKLLKGKKGQNKPTAAKPSEPPLPYPPPPPFIPLTAADVDDQIGLLKPYYHNRITLLAASLAPPMAVAPAPLPGPVLGNGIGPSPLSVYPSAPPPPMLPPGNYSASHSNLPPNPLPPPPPPPDLILPDDTPRASQLKMGPIGQIIKSSGTGGGTKKKGKVVVEGVGGAAVNAVAAPGDSTVPVAVSMSGVRLTDAGVQKKKKAATGVGTGNGRKKNGPPPEPTMVMG
ncbi:hypothetical protein BYT27DRAFT_6482270 [Phlegmacium glaucopus]|nr:hypothetical protein BYT27DRAFT_6482270 [Phlegmacium glaucopus]